MVSPDWLASRDNCREFAAAAHEDRLETLAAIEHGYELANTVDRELQAISTQSGDSEVARFVWAAQEERVVLERVIRDQKAHAAAAAETIHRLQSVHTEHSSREAAVRAAMQLRSREFQLAQWWAGVQHCLMLETAQRNAAEAALSAETLEDRRLWQARVLASRANIASESIVGGQTDEERAVTVRREARAVASITARIYDQVRAAWDPDDLSCSRFDRVRRC